MTHSAALSGTHHPPAQPMPSNLTTETGTDLASVVRIRPVRSSFEAFYAAERDGLVKVVTMVEGSPVAAADLVDEAMVRAFQRWPQVSQLERPAGWVYRVAINLGRSRFRRFRRDAKYRWLMLPEPEIDETVEDAFHTRVEDNRLIAALLALPIKQRAVVVARVLLDYSEAEVADALQIQPGTVKSRLSRALASLRTAVPDLAPAVERYVPDQTERYATGDVTIRRSATSPSVSTSPQPKGTQS